MVLIPKKFQIFAIFCLLLASCEKKQQQTSELPPVPVTVAKAIAKTVPYVVRTIGNTAAFSSVDIRPQVSGELTGFYFVDGQDVEEGALLFTIDTRPYEAVLTEARGQHEEAKAMLVYNREKVERYRQLLPDDFVSLLDFEQYEADKQASEGRVTQYEGAIKNAEVNLGFCTIQSPLSGRCGRHLFDPGNIVKTDQEDALVTIRQISPLYGMFTVAERFFPEIKRYQAQSKEGLEVEVTVVGEENRRYFGRLDFLNNTVDSNTGTVLLRSVFENKDKEMWPGQFIQVQINLYPIEGAILIPEQAIRRDTKGAYVFVCKEDQTVEKRRIEPGQLFDPLQVVLQGIQEGECVVTDGQMNLFNGAHYTIKEKGKGT